MTFTPRSDTLLNVLDDHTDHTYVAPVKLVKNLEDMQKWDRSQAYFEYLGFIYVINDLIRSKSNTEGSVGTSDEIIKIINILNVMDSWVDEFPRVPHPHRSGNPAFISWYNKLKEESINLLQSALPEALFRAIPEIMVYLEESFGNDKKISYGRGNETSFLMFLCALFKIGFLVDDDLGPTACKVFVRYLDVVRKLQQTYRMELAEYADGRGVYCLDDYQFVPYVWGSSQLIGRNLEPSQMVKMDIVEEYADEYIFMGCVRHTRKVKGGQMSDYSNMLWSLSGVSCWLKVNQGIIRMFKTNILSDFRMVKDIVFGSLFTLNRTEPGSSIRRPVTAAIKLPIRNKSIKTSVSVIYHEDEKSKSSISSETESEAFFSDETQPNNKIKSEEKEEEERKQST